MAFEQRQSAPGIRKYRESPLGLPGGMDPQKLLFPQAYWAGDSDISKLIRLSLQTEPCLADPATFHRCRNCRIELSRRFSGRIGLSPQRRSRRVGLIVVLIGVLIGVSCCLR